MKIIKTLNSQLTTDVEEFNYAGKRIDEENKRLKGTVKTVLQGAHDSDEIIKALLVYRQLLRERIYSELHKEYLSKYAFNKVDDGEHPSFWDWAKEYIE